ncbi:hypothetical protein AC578_5093 [Pseudocercospora eumusae]|uniref:Uncharacterized protein n=1 Tax=Pseudocercospora eumusae TaxID=321146 RepID=A0A139HIJ5_9PEZI|nr:hypothetical protein AC578_5093 [Pseudocercospora eumusae]
MSTGYTSTCVRPRYVSTSNPYQLLGPAAERRPTGGIPSFGPGQQPGNGLSTPFLAAALDTLCLVGLGTAHDDQNLLEEARVRYGNAMAMPSTELRHRKPSTSQFRPFDLVGLTNESNWCDAMAYAVHTQTQSNHEAAGQKSLLSALSHRPAGDDRFLRCLQLGAPY